MRVLLVLAAAAVVAAGCSSSNDADAIGAPSSPPKSAPSEARPEAVLASTVYLDACRDTLPLFDTLRQAYGDAWDAEAEAGKVIDGMREMPDWAEISQSQQEQTAAGVRAAAEGNCSS